MGMAMGPFVVSVELFGQVLPHPKSNVMAGVGVRRTFISQANNDFYHGYEYTIFYEKTTRLFVKSSISFLHCGRFIGHFGGLGGFLYGVTLDVALFPMGCFFWAFYGQCDSFFS